MTENKSNTIKPKQINEIPIELKQKAEAEVSQIDDLQILKQKRDK